MRDISLLSDYRMVPNCGETVQDCRCAPRDEFRGKTVTERKSGSFPLSCSAPASATDVIEVRVGRHRDAGAAFRIGGVPARSSAATAATVPCLSE